MASVPSGGAGGASAASGGAAAGGAGGAAEAAEEEKKEEGMRFRCFVGRVKANTLHREGRIRRGHGFRSLRLRNKPKYSWTCRSGLQVYRQSFWERLCNPYLLLHVFGVKARVIRSPHKREQSGRQNSTVETIQTFFFQTTDYYSSLL